MWAFGTFVIGSETQTKPSHPTLLSQYIGVCLTRAGHLLVRTVLGNKALKSGPIEEQGVGEFGTLRRDCVSRVPPGEPEQCFSEPEQPLLWWQHAPSHWPEPEIRYRVRGRTSLFSLHLCCSLVGLPSNWIRYAFISEQACLLVEESYTSPRDYSTGLYKIGEHQKIRQAVGLGVTPDSACGLQMADSEPCSGFSA